ncbi:MAG: hypothetical protein H7A46_21125 [Verrucomicrobiales bacterium]|nr:hypothetical protein [Verrucomicrobiales bacterium]
MRKRLIWLGVLLVGVGLSITVMVGLARSAPPRGVTLANGIVLECLGTTYGTNHVTPGSSRLTRLLPRPLRSWLRLGRLSLSFSTDTPSLVVWVWEDPASVTNLPPRTVVSMSSLLADEHGNLAGGSASSSVITGLGVLGQPRFPVVPRRSREITVKFYDSSAGAGRRCLGELVLRNPAFRQAPFWEPQPMPVSRTNGNLACTLERLVTGLGGIRGRFGLGGQELEASPAGSNTAPQALGVFRFKEDGLASEDWTLGRVSLADATGNFLGCWLDPDRDFGGLVGHRFREVLWPDEVWQVSAWAKRRLTRQVPEEELMVLKDIPVSVLTTTNQLSWNFKREGHEVRVERVVPRSSGVRELGRFRVTFPGLAENGLCDVVSLQDDQGRRLTRTQWVPALEGPGVLVITILSLPDGAKTLTLRLLLQVGRRFDFRVKPELVGTNGFWMELGG